jgi:hypothetical protein
MLVASNDPVGVEQGEGCDSASLLLLISPVWISSPLRSLAALPFLITCVSAKNAIRF